MNSELTKLSRCAILSALAFGIIAIYYGGGNPTFAQGQTQQQQQNQPAPIIAQNTSEPMQDPSQGNKTGNQKSRFTALYRRASRAFHRQRAY
jgi:hypothetical protein